MGAILLGRSLPPVLVDAVLELDDGEVADFERQGLVQEDGLGNSQQLYESTFGRTCLEQWVEASRLLPFLQLLRSGLDLGRV
jgi:hypothetical protein